MELSHAGSPSEHGDRPTESLPTSQLVRLSLYWLGLSSIFIGLTQILSGRIQYDEASGLFSPGSEGRTLFFLNVAGALIAALVQPTVGSISDYTMSRWGRRKPYIFIGSVLDIVFLLGIASSNTVLAVAAFMVLLQVSANFAQGPFQGYVPDLVPAKQVGLASALVGLFQVLGNVAGFGIGAAAVATNNFFLGTMALGVLELVTMVSVVWRVNEGKAARPREGKSWVAIGREAWGLDILAQRSFLWLVGSRWFVLMGANMLVNFALFYLAQTFALKQEETGGPNIALLGATVLGNVVAVIPAARLSDRIGRKPVIYAACAIGGLGMAIVAAAPAIPIAIAGAALFGAGSGMFLAVDWALMTDIIPKASSGRYMGISNVATATAGIFAVMTGGLLMDAANAAMGYGTGPRFALGLAVIYYVFGALLLKPVVEPRSRRDEAMATAG
ncbi:MAG TPA: MFS transporter [Candidatus Limnocylindrales bacterium]|nr:MFS transporter [Candidatus Limnocylindrales bacterium]